MSTFSIHSPSSRNYHLIFLEKSEFTMINNVRAKFTIILFSKSELEEDRTLGGILSVVVDPENQNHIKFQVIFLLNIHSYNNIIIKIFTSDNTTRSRCRWYSCSHLSYRGCYFHNRNVRTRFSRYCRGRTR